MSDDRSGSDHAAFDLLAEPLQEWIYKNKWNKFRPIQVEAIKEISRNKTHIVIAANTASGKTEAAFLPIISEIIKESVEGISAIYVGPLKALINDQFRRIQEICRDVDLPVHRWHGDVSQSKKISLLKRPRGILLITPESIESLFINKSEFLTELFGNLKFVVIDEIHAFVGNERGAHLRNLLLRMVRKSKSPVRTVSLSATIGDPRAIGGWLQMGPSDLFRVITDVGERRAVEIMVHGYLISRKPTLTKAADPDGDEPGYEKMVHDILSHFRNFKSLIFVNSKSSLEILADALNKLIERTGGTKSFLVHHGSLSKRYREQAEKELQQDRALGVICTSTLELGIDVGNLDIVGQVEPPWTVSSMIQRVGRSGREEGATSKMRFYLTEPIPEDADLSESLHLPILQVIASIELMIEKWCEPPDLDNPHFSTLVQQIMSITKEYGGRTPALLYDALISNGGFNHLTAKELYELIAHLKKKDILEETPADDLILGILGEKIANSFDFYSAFVTNDELAVVHKGSTVGTIGMVPNIEPGSHLLLAGKRWKILQFEPDRRLVTVEPAYGKKAPIYMGSSLHDVHRKIRDKMLEILHSNYQPKYIDLIALQILDEARSAAKNAQLHKSPLLQIGPDVFWFACTGSKIVRTLGKLLEEVYELTVDTDDPIITIRDITGEDLRRLLSDISSRQMPTEDKLAEHFSNKYTEKYDWLLPEFLINRAYAMRRLDIPETLCYVDECVSKKIGWH